MRKDLMKKLKESAVSVLPITAIVVVLALTLAPLPGPSLVSFVLAAVFLVFGMGLFTLGSEIAMLPMGEMVGSRMTQSRNLPFMIGVSLVMGMIITIAEPDLQVLAEQVPAFPSTTLILAVALGVGLFLVVALLRIVLQLPLNRLLTIFYALTFLVGVFVSNDFLPVAFDSGGVTTGPITVPFILALGIGVAAVRGGRSSQDDSFGLVALCSIGPILAVLVMGLFFDPRSGAYAPETVQQPGSYGEILPAFLHALPDYFREVALALSPIAVFFVIFQLLWLRLPARQLAKIAIGMVYAYVGLVVFLCSVNVGFMPVGNALGGALAGKSYNWIIVPIGMLIGFFIVRAEPAVHVLNGQVEEITDGAVSKGSMMTALSLGMAAAVGLAMLRVLTRWSIWFFLLPGYAIAIALSFFVPKIFTAVAFDSGGVASGPMTATFLLPFAMGACAALGGNIMADAFGIVAMVAMTPLITIQIMAFVYSRRTRGAGPELDSEPDEEIINLE